MLAKLIHDISAQVDKEEAAERAASERALALWKKNNRVSFVPAASKGPVSPAPYRRGVNNTNTKNYKYNTGQGSSGEGKNGNAEHRRVPSGESRVPEVFLKGLTLAVKSKSKEERINENCGVRDLRKRIEAMKLWRREIERTVVWQREEYRRVQKAIRRQNGHSEGNGSTGRSAARRVVQFEVEGGVEGKGKAKEGAEPVKTTGVQRYEGWGGGWQTWEKKRSVWLILFAVGELMWDTDLSLHLVVECQVRLSGKNCSAMAELGRMSSTGVA